MDGDKDMKGRVRTLNFLLGRGGPWGYMWFMIDFKNDFIKLLPWG